MSINRYYYRYVDAWISFLTPAGAKILKLDAAEAARASRVAIPKGLHTYIVAADVLGRITDIDAFLKEAKAALAPDGRLIITQYSALWEPVLRLASHLGLRSGSIEQNWLSMQDLKNFAYLAGLEPVKAGSKMLMPIYIPLVSAFFNAFVANIWPFSKLGFFHYLVLRKPEPREGVTAATPPNKKPSLSIVVPARNEAGTIETIARTLPEVGAFTEIIFIEGNSTDNTYAEIERVAREMGSKRKILTGRQGGRGKGDAVRVGFEMATGDIITIYDADMTVPAEDVAKFYDAIVENKGDFINGSRLVYPMEQESMRILNFFGNKFFSLAFSWILGQPLKDTLCGTKMLRRSDYEKVKQGRAFFGDFDPFGDFDLLFGAAKLNLKIVDLPVHYKQRVYGTTNISRWKHGLLLLRMTAFAARKLKFI